MTKPFIRFPFLEKLKSVFIIGMLLLSLCAFSQSARVEINGRVV